MSKPETPNGAQIVDLMGALRASLGVRQDAPKAEAPPKPKRVNHKWRYESTDGVKDSVVSTCTVCGLRLDGWPGTHRNPGCKPAPPAPKCDHARIDPSQPYDVCPPAPVSEPPIDWKRVLKFANEYEDDWTPGDLPNASRAILSLIAERDALKAKLEELPADWWEDSSLKTWFPLTAEELDDLKAQNAELEKDLVMMTNERDIIYADREEYRERVQAAERDSSASMELYRSAVARRDDAEAKTATLTAEVKRLRETNTSLNRRATKAEGVVLSKARHESAAGRSLGRALANASWVAISAENDGLRETLQDIAKLADFQIPPYAYGDNEAACDMAHRLEQIFRSAREAGKA